MKPITEHPEFIAQLERQVESVYKNQKLIFSSGYNFGASYAQSILQKQHESEMERFTDWLFKVVESGTVEVDNGYWIYYKDFEGVPLDGNQLLQLFRDGQG